MKSSAIRPSRARKTARAGRFPGLVRPPGAPAAIEPLFYCAVPARRSREAAVMDHQGPAGPSGVASRGAMISAAQRAPGVAAAPPCCR